jgi:hypothetical protein
MIFSGLNALLSQWALQCNLASLLIAERIQQHFCKRDVQLAVEQSRLEQNPSQPFLIFLEIGLRRQ